MDFKKYSDLYKNELLENVVPFWLKNSPDKEYGGYFSCLNTKGEVYETDKFLWLQGRQIWTFSMLYNNVEKREEWLDFAEYGAKFMLENGRDDKGNWYFSLDKKGNPLVQPYNIFSDCFAAMAFGQLYKATKNEEYLKTAKDTFSNILKRQHNPKGIYSKAYPGTRNLQDFALPMILSNLVLEIEHVLDQDLVEKTIDEGIDAVINKFYRPELGIILENIKEDESLSDSFEGRLVNPGHGMEAMWFIMDLAERKNDKALMQKCVAIALKTLDYGWDDKHGGIFYFMDRKGNPPQQLEWNQKLWWVHLESIITMLKGYLHTGNEECLAWFKKLHEYSWKNFADSEHGEWFGYLNRQGEVLLQAKGGKWKGCFHVPRALYQGWKTLDEISAQK